MAKHKPADPAEIMRRRHERQANEAEISRLRSLGAVVSLDRARRIVSAYRKSAFHKLAETKTITQAQASAAERLCEDWAIWRGLDGRPPPLEHGTNPNRTSSPDLLTDRMLKAGDRINAALVQVGPQDRELLISLVASAVEDDNPLPWRDTVRRVTGTTQTVRQSQMIVAALGNLARAYGTGSSVRRIANL
jgi:hypothetical protein